MQSEGRKTEAALVMGAEPSGYRPPGLRRRFSFAKVPCGFVFPSLAIYVPRDI